MSMMKDMCSWTEGPTGQIVVGASVLILGLTHFGFGMGMGDMGFGGISVGMIAGTVGVVVGVCILANRFM